jgi:hypothetical protein
MHGVRELSRQRVGTYWHCLPEYEQARKALWNGVDSHTGIRRMEAVFPKEAGFKHNDTQMMVTMPWGSTWQLIGSDRYDATVGAGPVGIVYSEWALANPSAYAYHKPMLLESKGKAAFITTPRGNNHAHTMLKAAQAPNSGWFWEVLPAAKTGTLTAADLEESLTEYQALYGIDFGRAYFEQEYLCSFSGAQLGALFGAEVAKAEREGRICDVPVDWDHPVHTVWDLGKAQNNPIWCFQVIAGVLRIVDFHIPESDDVETWVAWLNERGYRGHDYVPHDIMVTEWGSKRTRFETLVLLGRRPVRVAKVSLADGLQAGRAAINAAVFNDSGAEGERVAQGIEGLKNYRREWDDELKTFRADPVKDWAEHRGSAWRYLGLAWKEFVPPPVREKKPAVPVGHVVLPGPPEARKMAKRIRI